MASLPTLLPQSAIINLNINQLQNVYNAYLLSGLNNNGQVLSNILVNIVNPVDPPINTNIISIILPRISALNIQGTTVTINYNNSPLKVQILGYRDLETGHNVDFICGDKSIPCVNHSGFQQCSVVGLNEWTSFTEVVSYAKVLDGNTATDLPSRAKIEFQGANVSLADDPVAEKTIVTINP